MWLLDLFGSGLVNLKSQNLKSVLPCACFHGFFSRVLGFPVTMLHTLLGTSIADVFRTSLKFEYSRHLPIAETGLRHRGLS